MTVGSFCEYFSNRRGPFRRHNWVLPNLPFHLTVLNFPEETGIPFGSFGTLRNDRAAATDDAVALFTWISLIMTTVLFDKCKRGSNPAAAHQPASSSKLTYFRIRFFHQDIDDFLIFAWKKFCINGCDKLKSARFLRMLFRDDLICRQMHELRHH